MYSYNPYYANYLMHYGTATSGRYPRGSGDRPYQHEPGKVKYSKRINKFVSQAAKKKIKSDYKSGEYSKEAKNDLIKGVNTVYKYAKKTIKDYGIKTTKDQYYQNTTGEFRDTHSKSRFAVSVLTGGWIPNAVRHITLSNASLKYERLPEHIQSKVDTYINEAKKANMIDVNNKIAELEKKKIAS